MTPKKRLIKGIFASDLWLCSVTRNHNTITPKNNTITQFRTKSFIKVIPI